MLFTYDQNKVYLERKGRYCPKCDRNAITVLDLVEDEDRLIKVTQCQVCGCKYNAIYVLTNPEWIQEVNELKREDIVAAEISAIKEAEAVELPG